MNQENANNSITPFLWFNDNLEQALAFYKSIFKDFEIQSLQSMGEGEQKKVFGASFCINKQNFHAINAGPMYSFNPSISFFVACDNQLEIDYYWEKFLDGGQELMCGWITDKFGLTWQIVPSMLGNFIRYPEGMTAMRKMKKLEIETLKKATEKYN
ncbi:MAG: VOC family protein [Flavobacteriia bacterium]|nr:VOC family protein [Flavobacteriia bacterium]